MTRTMLVKPFAAEGQQARNLGYEMRLFHDEAERIVQVRMVPLTDRLRARLAVLSIGEGDAIEAGCTYEPGADLLDVIRETAKTALQRAREVA